MSARRIPAAALLLALVGGGARGEEPSVVHYLEERYAALDPAAARTENDERLVLALFEPLTALDPATGRAAPGAADRWIEAADGRSWTFHLRADATWSDGRPVRAADFAFAWRRLADPETAAPGATLLRAVRGGWEMEGAALAVRVLDALGAGLKELAEANPQGIPGDRIGALVDASGARAHAQRIDNPAVRRLLSWGSDPFPVATAGEAREVIRTEKRRHRDAFDVRFETFGRTTGVVAKDDRTLVVETDGPRPYLPELVARAPLSPVREDLLAERREEAFEPIGFVGCGPFLLKGRGARPRAGVDRPESVVHLVRSDKYRGRASASAEVLCWTDLGATEEISRLGDGRAAWLPRASAAHFASLSRRPGFEIRPTGGVLCLVIRPDRKPFDRPALRRALAKGIDRTAAAKALWPAAVAAGRLLPPTLSGAPPAGSVPPADAAAAKAALAESKVKPEDVPWIDLHHPDEASVAEAAGRLTATWEALGLPGAPAADTGSEAGRLLSGRYPVRLAEIHPAFDDLEGVLAPFHSRSADLLLGSGDEVFETLLDGARDPDGVADAPEKVLAAAPDRAAIEALLPAARAKTAPGRAALRAALLAAAERRLLDAVLVVPIAWTARASFTAGAKGMGDPPAWRNPAFAGSLRGLTR